MKKIQKLTRSIVSLLVLISFLICSTSIFAQCPPVFQNTTGIGNIAGFPLKDYLHVRWFGNCPKQEPALRLDYDNENYFGQLSLIKTAGRNSDLATTGDLVLRASCKASDIIITTQNNIGAIRFGTTQVLAPNCLLPGDDPLPPYNDLERMTILGNGNVGIGEPLPKTIFSIGNTFTFMTGSWKSMNNNFYWDGSVHRRIVAGPAAKVEFDPDGAIWLTSVPTGILNEAITSDVPSGKWNNGFYHAQNSTGIWNPKDGHIVRFTNSRDQDRPNLNYFKNRVYIGTVDDPGHTPFAQNQTPPYEESDLYKLAVNGSILCKEIVVDAHATWPDYVFDEDYQLLPLDELEAFIIENNHLPEIPSEKVIEKQRMGMGELQITLLKKVEELTLYVIQLRKEIDNLKSK